MPGLSPVPQGDKQRALSVILDDFELLMAQGARADRDRLRAVINELEGFKSIQTVVTEHEADAWHTEASARRALFDSRLESFGIITSQTGSEEIVEE